MIHVVLRSIAGECLELDVDHDADVWTLKERVQESWQIPPLCQELVAGDTVLLNDRRANSYLLADDQPLSLTMLISLDRAQRGLESNCFLLQLDGLRILAELGLKGGEGAIALLSEPRWGWGVRYQAVRTLAKVAERGNVRAMAALNAFLEDACREVRVVAIEALAQVAIIGDAWAIAAATDRLEDRSQDVQDAAFKVLAQVCERGDERVIAAVSARLHSEDPAVRYRAVKALSQLAKKGDQHAICAASIQLEDRNSLVRKAADEALDELRAFEG
mmetsp:Transcript_11613/g.34435  ORF Transcript_11613/g.34435 Transcript_11613/m.34435 type:complete len:275 (-) Transcript_11613:32-856(-)